jgi:uncharacterized integral membrane protein
VFHVKLATLAGTDWLVWAFMLAMFLMSVVCGALIMVVRQLRKEVNELKRRVGR